MLIAVESHVNLMGQKNNFVSGDIICKGSVSLNWIHTNERVLAVQLSDWDQLLLSKHLKYHM